jgi:mannose-6-phosphate isomerase class I
MIDSKKKGKYDKYPEKLVEGYEGFAGWQDICSRLQALDKNGILVAEFYPGVDTAEIARNLNTLGGSMFNAEDCMISKEEYHARIKPYLTEDRVFGVMNTLRLEDVYSPDKIQAMQREVQGCAGRRIIYGTGASLITHGDVLIYFDMPRWELQCRYKNGAGNWHTDNCNEDKLKKFKQGYFVEWRMADRKKRQLLDKIDYIIDTVQAGEPKMVCGDGFRAGLQLFAREPFRLKPYFAPEVWGGQWMKEVCDLPREEKNYAWAFDGVPEENSILMRFGDVRLELPSINVVFYCPRQLLGDRVHARFGEEFPIRFDFLDTMGGQNLSLQVHPLTEYIQNTFGMHYTQDESYYILDCEDDAQVFLGLKEDIDRGKMLSALREAQEEGLPFEAEAFVNAWTVKKHDHYLIPAGTIHCSGKNTMILEISATPYIFTFKLWDWGRIGLDGKPRPVHLQHGEQVIQWDRTTKWVKESLINCVETLCEEKTFKEERTGLHEREFIETRRYTLRDKKSFVNGSSVSMCNVVDGEGVIITSPDNSFAPFTVHYAETFIIPASVRSFSMEPLEGACMVLRATVR